MTETEKWIAQLRRDFPILNQRVNNSPLIYFDNAATTQKPRQVMQVVDRYYQKQNANVHRASHALSARATTAFEQARETVANFLNARNSKEIIWTRGTTESINLLANSFGNTLKAGDEIILSTHEHHANIVPWQMLAERTGVVLKIIPLNADGSLDQNAYKGLLSPKTKLVALSYVSNALGIINPVAEMIADAHEVGAKVLIDGAQAVPHFAVDVQALDADFFAFSGHKLFGPTGIGVLYGKQALLEQLPPWQGGGEMIQQVSFSGTTYNEIPFRFEAGTPPIAEAIGLASAIDWLNQHDRQRLEAHEQALLHQARSGCQQIKGWQETTSLPQQVSLLSFSIAQLHQQDLGLLLDQQGIAVRTGHHCAMPLMHALGLPGTTRASFAFYNTHAEVERFLEVLDQLSLVDQVSVSLNSSKSANLHQQLLAHKDWNSRYRTLMLAGKQHQGLSDADKTEQHRVQGCESNTWLISRSDDTGKLHFSADSEARIIKGLLVLALELYNGKNAAEICQTDPGLLFAELKLDQHLSPSRGNGLRAVIERIHKIAEHFLEQQ